MLTDGLQAVGPQLQLGVLAGHAQSVTTHGSAHAWQTMSDSQSVSAAQCAGTQPYSIVVTQGTGAGHTSPGVHGAEGAQVGAATWVHSKPYAQAGPVPQPGA